MIFCAAMCPTCSIHDSQNINKMGPSCPRHIVNRLSHSTLQSISLVTWHIRFQTREKNIHMPSLSNISSNISAHSKRTTSHLPSFWGQFDIWFWDYVESSEMVFQSATKSKGYHWLKPTSVGREGFLHLHFMCHISYWQTDSVHKGQVKRLVWLPLHLHIATTCPPPFSIALSIPIQ